MVGSKVIPKVLGLLFVLLAFVMAACIFLAYQDGDDTFHGFLYGSIGVGVVGGIFLYFGMNQPSRIKRKEGYLIVTLAWMGMGLVFSIPYYLSLDISLVNAMFESVSGLTTTGATIFNDIEALPRSILLWRSLSQWIGGMGIIVLSVALMPLLGVGGVELFTAEAPGPTADKIHPRIQIVARSLWLIYVGLTALLFLILWALPMDLFDAANHALTTMATGGFSTKNSSIAHFNSPAIEYVISIFMLLAGINYTVLFFMITRRFFKAFSNEELRMYLFVVFASVFVVFLYLIYNDIYSIEASFRYAFFQVVSIITTTGYGTADYVAWGSGMSILFFILLFVGGSAGSTSGGIKAIRHLALLKNVYFEFNRLLHPKAMIRIKINKELVAPRVMTHILVFLLIYIMLFFLGALVLSFCGSDAATSFGISATSLGNVGPGIGDVGPSNNFSSLSATQKWVSLVLMLLGRLELFSVLILLTPYYWKK